MSDFAAPLRGKCALVTGAATGIGKGIATALAAAGAQVVVNHNHTPEPAEKLAAAINEAGGTAMAWPPTSAAAPSTRRWFAGCWPPSAAGTSW